MSELDTIEVGDRGDPRRPDDHRGRRRRSRERGRPDHGGGIRHARAGRVHGPPYQRHPVHAGGGRRRGAAAPAPMVNVNDAPMQTAFTVSVDYRYGLTTGISAEERTGTIRALANRNVGPEDFVRPGHIFPSDRPRRRSAGPLRPHRGRGRLLPAGWGRDRRRARRAGQRRRHGEAAAGLPRVRQGARAAHRLDRRSDRVPSAARPARAQRRQLRGRDCRPARPRRSSTRRRSTRSSTWPWSFGDLGGGERGARRASTASSRWATCCVAALGSRRRWPGSAGRGAACSCCCATL